MEACQTSPPGLHRPPQLNSYLSNNELASPTDAFTLDAYLDQLSKSIDELEGNIGDLAVVSDEKMEAAERLRQEYKLLESIKSPVRQIPHDVLGIIFGFTVGAPPFNRFINVAHLRGVCSTWRQAALTTPGLWNNLSVDLDTWCPIGTYGLDTQALLHRFEEELEPWMAILSRRPRYHLELTSSVGVYSLSSREDHLQLAQYLLSSTLQPGRITLTRPHAVAVVMQAIAQHGLTLSALRLDISARREAWEADLQALGSGFPHLEALDIGSRLILSVDPAFHHSFLQVLYLRNICGRGDYLHRLIHGLPSLRELTLHESLPWIDNQFVDPSPLPLPTIPLRR